MYINLLYIYIFIYTHTLEQNIDIHTLQLSKEYHGTGTFMGKSQKIVESLRTLSSAFHVFFLRLLLYGLDEKNLLRKCSKY